MLMTVLHGELAIRQSKALIRTFKAMKDFIIQNAAASTRQADLQLALEVAENTTNITAIQTEVKRIDNELKTILDEVVLKSELSPILQDFSKATRRQEFLLRDGELAKADETYIEIFAQAEENIYVIDNYINIKTLRLLQKVRPNVSVTIFSDNLNHGLHASDYQDFQREFPQIKVKFRRNCKKVHDRFIILDFETKNERIFHSGASAKDAGKKLTAIYEWAETGTARKILHETVLNMLKNPKLRLT